MKEKLLANYGETMKLKGDMGNSYCECSGFTPIAKNKQTNKEEEKK